MTEAFFRDQVRRLRVRFGEKALDAEFIQLVWREVHEMSENNFQRLADVLIGTRNHTRPPSIVDFREARQREEKREFDNDVRGAANAMGWPAKGGLQRYLTATYGSECKTLNQAVEMQIEMNKLKRMTGEGA